MKVLKEENLYSGFLKLDKLLVELPTGEKISREIIKKKDTVSIIAINDKNEVYFTKQPRVGAQKLESIELPAGLIEDGEIPEEAAARELEEETGCIATEYINLQKFISDPACCQNCSYIFLAKHAKKVKELKLDDDEYLESFTIPIDIVFKMVRNGEINDSASLIALLKLRDCDELCDLYKIK